jgi:hypothetical protein
VTRFEWTVGVASLAVGLFGCAARSHEDLVPIALLLAAAAIALTASAFRQALQTRMLGKLLLMLSMVWIFWLQVVSCALEPVPFAVPSEAPIVTPQYQLPLVQRALCYLALFQLSLLIGYSIRPRLKTLSAAVASRADVAGRTPLRLAYASCVFVPIVVNLDFDVRRVLDYLLGAYRRFAEYNGGTLDNLLLFGMYGAGLLVLEGLLFRPPHRFARIAGGLVATLGLAMSGTRHLLLFIILPLAALALLKMKGELRPGFVLKLCGCFAVLMVFFQIQAAVRTTGWETVTELSLRQLLPDPSDGQFTALLFAEDLVPGHHGYFLDPVEPHFLFYWIPRSVWPSKPVIPSWQYYNDVYTRQDPVWNVTPSVIGQYHMSWGPFGVVAIGLWLGLVMYAADRLLSTMHIESHRCAAVLVGMLYAFVVCSFRNYLPYYAAYMVAGAVAVLTLTRRPRPVRIRASAHAAGGLGFQPVPAARFSRIDPHSRTGVFEWMKRPS